MRISTRRLKRRRLKILEARKEGATYLELRTKFGASPNYLSKILKGKDINKHCKHCGENDPEVLVKHHPDKENRPDYFKWLCSNCHSKVTRREETQRRAKQKEIEQQSIPSQFPTPQTTYDRSQIINKSATSPFEYKKLTEGKRIAPWTQGEKIAFCGLVAAPFVIDYFLKRRKEIKIKRELQTSEANANQQNLPVGKKGFVETFLGKMLIGRTPAKIIEEYPKAFKVQLPDTRKIVIPKDKFVERA